MSATETISTTLPPGIERGKKYRFVVRSAEEAIHILRTRLGEEAKVLSVKQIGGKGLNKFLQSPRMEIIATVPNTGADVQLSESAIEKQEPITKKNNPAETTETKTAGVEDALREGLDSGPSKPATNLYRSNDEVASRQGKGKDIWELLRRSHFSEGLISTLRYASQDGSRLEDLPTNLALAEVRQRLIQSYKELDILPITKRVAFLGTPGTGKTTALCKRLAHDIFIARKDISVLKIDNDTPNPDEALSIFCDVLGVPLMRDPVDREELEGGDTLYLDLPGVNLYENEDWARLVERLDTLEVQTRILVVNGCYEMDQIEKTVMKGERLGVTHLCITHMDEVTSSAKFWPIVLRSGLSPYFISNGQSVTGDYTDDVEQYLSEKSFPLQHAY